MEDGTRAQLAPAHACPLHALLDQVLGAAFDRATPDRQTLPTEQWVLHA
jgi:hypothetical protein